MVGSEGTLGIVLEAKLRLVPLPKAKAVMVIMFADLLESLAATPVILRHKPSAVEVMDKSILDHTRQNAALDRIRNTYIEGDPGRHAVRRVLRRSQGRPAAAPAGARSRICARAASGYAYRSRNRPRGAGPHLEPARSVARPFDGDEGRRQVDLHSSRTRRSRRRNCAISSSASSASSTATEPPPASTRTPRSDACTSAR